MIKNKSTEILKEEHKVIKVILDVLEEITKRAEKREKIDSDDVLKIIDFIRTFADKCHHGKEEDLLFVEMEKAGVPKEGGPIGVMLQEHDIGRNYVRGMDEAIKKYKSNKTGIKEFIENAYGYVDLLRQHIDKEDNILYMMADMHLSSAQQEKLIKEFDKVEEKMGEGVHEKYHKLAESLKEKYLKK